MILNRLNWLAEKKYWFNSKQYGFRPGKDATIAIVDLKNFILEGNTKNNKTLMISFDIAKAFDSVIRSNILIGLKSKHCPINLFRIIQSFLSDRSTQLSLGDVTSYKNSQRGCPQGSSLSPFLWNISFNSILELNLKATCRLQAFADDLVLLCRSKDISLLKSDTEEAISRIYKWGYNNHLNFNPDKTKACLFHKSRTPINLSIKVNNISIPIDDHINILGVHFDRKLNFKHHINRRIQKLNFVFSRLVNSIGNNFGPDTRFITSCYNSLVLPILSYGAPAWSNILKYDNIKNKLNSFQRLWMLRITKSASSISTLDAFALTGVLPVEDFISMTCKKYDITLTSRSPSNITLDSSPFITKLPYPPLLHTVTSPLPYNKPNFTIYTDGSKSNQGVGAGFCIFDDQDNRIPSINNQFHLHKNSTIFQAEAYALLKSLEEINLFPIHSNITIFSDSKSLVESITNLTLNSKLLLEIWNKLQSLENVYNISLAWVKGHSGLQGNETADSIAKNAISPTLPITFNSIAPSTQKSIYKIEAWNIFDQKYISSTHRKRLLKFNVAPSMLHRLKHIVFNSHATSLFLTGIGFVMKHLIRTKKSDTDLCRFCNSTSENIDHLVLDCPALTRKRMFYPKLCEVTNNSSSSSTNKLPIILENKEIWNQVISFIEHLKLQDF